MFVFVKSVGGIALNPCSVRKARLLLSSKRAEVVSYCPFTIQLNYETRNLTNEYSIGIDTGATHIGVGVTICNMVVHKAEIQLRNDVSELLSARRIFRRSRRARNTRYRQPRFLNRAKSKGWLPPSILSKVNHTIRWIDKYCALVPNHKLNIEVGNFDVAKIIDPDIQSEQYQQGQMLGYENVKQFVLASDNHTCQYCKKRNLKLHVHHIIFKSQGGSDRPDNLVTLCEQHHKELHAGIINPKFKKPRKYQAPVIMNVIKSILVDYYDARFTYGYETKVKRVQLRLNKSHANDAVAISNPDCVKNDVVVLRIKQCRKKKRSLHEATPRKGRKQPNRDAMRNSKNTSKVGEFHLHDKVMLGKQIGWISGFTGQSAYVQDKDGNYISNKSYKQVALKELKIINHNNNWRHYYG